MSNFETFLRKLFETGQAEVATPDPVGDEELRAADSLLFAFDQEFRNCLPNVPPELDINAARWAAAKIYRATQCIAFRDIPEQDVIASFANNDEPNTRDAKSHYSVDLHFRFLPDLLQHATRASEDDAIVQQLKTWCVQWPLSSVGVSNLGECDIGGFQDDVCLLMEYLNRIVERKDFARAQHPAVQELLRTQLGNYPSLVSSGFLQQLSTTSDEET